MRAADLRPSSPPIKKRPAYVLRGCLTPVGREGVLLRLTVFFLVLSSFSYGNMNFAQFFFRVGGLIFALFLSVIFFSGTSAFLKGKHSKAFFAYSRLTGDKFRVNKQVLAINSIFLITILFLTFSSFNSFNPALSFWKAGEIIFVLLVINLILARATMVAGLEWYWFRLFFTSLQAILILGILTTIAVEGGGILKPGAKLGGYFPSINPNSMGGLSALCVLFNFSAKRYGLVFFWLAIIFLSGSKTAMIGLLFIIFLYFMFFRPFSSYSVGVARTFYTILASAAFIYGFDELGALFESSRDLSGRRVIWESYISFIYEDDDWLNYFKGAGIGSSREFHLYINEIRRPVSLHNAWLEALISGGAGALLGLFVLFFKAFFGLFSISRKAIQNADFEAKELRRLFGYCFFMLTLVGVRSLTSSNISSISPEFILFVFLCLLTARNISGPRAAGHGV